MSEPNGIVRISDVKVEGNTPHDDEPHVDLHQLPGDGATGAHQGVCVLHDHDLSVSWEDVPWRKCMTCFSTLSVCLHI